MTTSQAHPSAIRPDDGRPSIVSVGLDRRPDAIARLLATGGPVDLDHARRFLEYARENAVSLDHLWAAIDGQDRFQSVVLAVPGAGRSAMIFSSQSPTEVEQKRTAAVLEYGMRKLRQVGVHLAQTLIDPHETDAIATCLHGGFHHLATLSYLERALHPRRLPAKPVWPEDASIEQYDESMRRELIAALDDSYEETLDCPGLRGHRDTADILEGHRASGQFVPRLWTLLRISGMAAGVLLLNPSSDRTSIELVYLGLAKSARGRGLGVQLLRHGLHLVANRPERTMTLAVDEDNAPALNLYKREQFRTVLRRVAMIRGLRHARAE